jgi:hypothetical protein
MCHPEPSPLHVRDGGEGPAFAFCCLFLTMGRLALLVRRSLLGGPSFSSAIKQFFVHFRFARFVRDVFSFSSHSPLATSHCLYLFCRNANGTAAHICLPNRIIPFARFIRAMFSALLVTCHSSLVTAFNVSAFETQTAPATALGRAGIPCESSSYSRAFWRDVFIFVFETQTAPAAASASSAHSQPALTKEGSPGPPATATLSPTTESPDTQPASHLPS